MNLTVINKDKWVQDVKTDSDLVCSDQEIVEFRILKGGNTEKKQDYNPGLHKNSLWPFQGPAWTNPMGDKPGEKSGPREPVDFQG